ncbi:unnamed protein product [Calicophoron daubneyi]|uniref:NIF3-like protein 1 n=1 Tax=Calicophoron daubneyi TaxID=300641 RepID=A0AAV2T4U8_CALDB
MDLPFLVSILNRYCMPHLADSWDNVGLLVEPSVPLQVRKVLVTNDLTEPVLDEAVSTQSNLILSYHPPIFTPIKRIVQRQWKDRIVARCLENRIAIFSPHTGLDAKQGGVNDWLLSPLEVANVRALTAAPFSQSLFSLDVPINEKFSQFCLNSGVSVTDCHLSSSGSRVAKVTCSAAHIDSVLAEASNSGVTIISKSLLPEVDTKAEGYGRIAHLKFSVSLSTVIEAYKKLFKADRLLVALGIGKTIDDPVNVVAVCAGSGGSILCRNPMALTADVFVTGEMSHHDRLEAISRGISVIIAGHSTSERGYLEQQLIPDLQAFIRTSSDGDSSTGVQIQMSKQDREPGCLM